MDLTQRFDAAALGPDPAAYLARQEARFDDIVPGVEKRILWADEVGAKTKQSVLYIHGFSATSEEIRPVPDKVAQALGANLVFTRLAGHGRGSAAMAEPRVADWVYDVDEALAVAGAVGERIIVISTSTGGTLAALAARDSARMGQVAGMIFVSPNFGLNHSAAGILTWPGVRWWGPLLLGKTRSFTPVNDRHGTFWTTQYPSVSVLPMAALAKYAAAADYSRFSVPALFVYDPRDKVVTPKITAKIAAHWGGAADVHTLSVGPGDDPYAHVIAGDILSPGQTGTAAQVMLDWIRRLPDA